MNYTITHTTTYSYYEPVSLCHNIIRLKPRTTGMQTCLRSTVKISPHPDTFDEYEDFFGNKVIYFSIDREHRQLVVNVVSEVEKKEITHIDNRVTVKELQEQLLPHDIRQFVPETPMTIWNDEIREYAATSFAEDRPVIEATKELMHRIYKDFEFKPGFTTIATPLSIVMQQRKGVCQDFSHLAIACIRSMGLPARYVSGYLETISPEGTEKLIGVDASHAWFSIYIPPMGWVDFDPTNNMLPSEQHITIGWGRDYADIAPLKGVIVSSGLHELSVAVDVKRTEVV